MKVTERIPAVLATAAFLASALLLNAQSPSSAEPHPDRPPVPRTELFLGYTHIHATPTEATGNRLDWLNGGSASLAYNFTRSFGLVTDFGGYDATQLYLSGPGVAAPGAVSASGTAYSFLFGPRFSLRTRHFTPFVQVLGGGAYATAVTLTTCLATTCTPLPEQGAFALTAGGGLDINLSRHIALRAFQAEYLMTRFASTTTELRSTQNDIRLASGLVFRFGFARPVLAPTPVNHAPISVCSADRSVVRGDSGRPLLLQAQAADVDGNPLTYTWTASSGTLSGASSANAEWNLDGLSPGQYSAKLHVEDGRGGVADCSVNVSVEPAPAHPSLTCSVGKSPVFAGDTVPVSAVATNLDPQTITWTTSSGRIDGSGTSVRLITSPGFVGTYVVSAHATGLQGEPADCQANGAVQQSPQIAILEKRLSLHSIYFPTAEPPAGQPDRGLLPSERATLVQLAADFVTYSATYPDAKLILDAHADPRGSVEYNQSLTERRGEVTKRFLVEHGVPEASIKVNALGDQHNMTDAEVSTTIDNNDELTPEERTKLRKNMHVIILASNRRVDVTLSSTSQHSVRQFPFNAKDALILISPAQPSGARKTPARKPVQ